MITNEVFAALKNNSNNIHAFTFVEDDNHVSINNNTGHNIETSLDIFGNSPQGRLDKIQSIFVTWKGKASTARNLLKEIEGIKLFSVDNPGHHPQDIITPA